MKCRVCGESAVIDVRRHNANFCADHFVRHCRDQTERTIREFEMAQPGERLLTAVSGGKDSLAIWDLLLDLGFAVDGLYIGLGIGEYSDRSGEYVRRFATERAEPRGGKLIEIDLRHEYGFDVPTAADATGRVPCSACGLSKRHLFDRAAVEGGYDAIVTGHNLDDEAAVLYGNVLRWQTDYLGRQRPALAAANGFPRKIKPLVRLSERDTAAYCVIRGIDYQVEECPMAEGNKHLEYKAALNVTEEASPGAKQAFYFGFLASAVDRFEGDVDEGLVPCANCGAPTTDSATGGGRCSFCRLVAKSQGADPVPIELMRKKRR